MLRKFHVGQYTDLIDLSFRGRNAFSLTVFNYCRFKSKSVGSIRATVETAHSMISFSSRANLSEAGTPIRIPDYNCKSEDDLITINSGQ